VTYISCRCPVLYNTARVIHLPIFLVYQHERISGAHGWFRKQTAGCTVWPADKTLSKDEEKEMKEWKRELKL